MQNEIDNKPLANTQLEAQVLEKLQESVRRDPSAQNFHNLQNRISAENKLGETYGKALEDEVSRYDAANHLKNLTQFGREIPELSNRTFLNATPDAYAMVADNEKMQLASLALKHIDWVGGSNDRLNDRILEDSIQDVTQNGYKGLKGMVALQSFCKDLTKSVGRTVSIEDHGIIREDNSHYGKRHLTLQMEQESGSTSRPIYVTGPT